MDISRLIQMANQIAINMKYENDVPAAISEHIRLFWDPHMRRAICEYQGEDLVPAAHAAVARLLLSG